MKKRLILGTSIATLALLAGCSTNGNNDDKASSSQSTTATSTVSSSSSASSTASSTSASSTSSTSTASSSAAGAKVTVDEAIKAYQETYPGSDITSIELKDLGGQLTYTIEGVDDQNEYEARINGETKEVTKGETETLDDDDADGIKRREDSLDLKNLIDIQKATQIAEEKAGSGEAVEWDLSKDDDEATFWDVKVKDGTKETEVKINAQTAEILDIDNDD